ncbi:MAG: hypothetical protein A4E72_00609 [Syntrophus sp. PtaU1.Bin208]|nr:MAG: hypothetical protein A4E72_00609 [Syntrophus sp. PtaU1.Bin208]
MTSCHKKTVFLFSLLCLCFFGVAGTVGAAETAPGMLVMKLAKQDLSVASLDSRTAVSGEVVYRMTPKDKTMVFELSSFSLVGSSVRTKQGDSGPLSLVLKPSSAKSAYNPRTRTIKSQFLLEVHYPLIDKVKGFMEPKEGQREKDDYRSFTETFAGSLICKLSETPRIGRSAQRMKEGAAFSLKMEPREKVLGEVAAIAGEFKVIDVIVWPRFYIKKTINIQPVFVRYTPADGCFGGTTTATTGGSFQTLRDKAIEMWNRCCIGLNFLAPVYIDNDDYRILSSAEEAGIKAAYDDPNAIEVYFVEVGDPVGIHGGGVCYSSGTANAKVITYDTNLPINLYNLAHELGHALGLMHPPGNSTVGSLMEPSGFCADNPSLMSKLNCDNASNPLLVTPTPIPLCTRSINMP